MKCSGSVYLTSDVDQTAKWFEEVLGWYAGVEVDDGCQRH